MRASLLQESEGVVMSLLKLRLAMAGTLALIISISTLALAILLHLFGALNLTALLLIVVAFNLAQWLFAPYLIEAVYRVKPADPTVHSWLITTVEKLSAKMGIRPPQVMVANVPVPNAFAYGSPLTGSRVAVTTGLLKELEREEVEAVVGHELGHLKHRDVQVMMFASVLPAIFYYIGYSLMMSAWWGAYSRRSEEGGPALVAAVGLVSMALYWVLTLFVLYLSRLREYYADRASATTVEDGARKLSEALAKIATESARLKVHGQALQAVGSFKALLIEDPDSAPRDAATLRGSDDELVRRLASRKLTWAEKLSELFSTHPHIVKRIRALQELT